MFEARLVRGHVLKQIVEAIKDLVTEANLDCSEHGLGMQAMDGNHVMLISLMLRERGFEHFRADQKMTLGVSFKALALVLKGCGKEDVVTLVARDDTDHLSLVFESPTNSRVSSYSLKLLDIDSEHLGIGEMEYPSTIEMPSGEFERVVRELRPMGDSLTLLVSESSVQFSTSGDMGTAAVVCRPEKDKVTIKCDGTVTSDYCMRYVAFLAKAATLSERVRLNVSPSLPLRVEYELEELGFLRFYLCGKINDNA